MHVLFVEDDASIAMGLQYSLENEGYKVTLAKTLKEATDIIESQTFDLYILDLGLPDGSGYEICRKVKASGDYPVIFLTAMDDEVNVVMGLDLGADDYITKPFRIKELIARMKSVLRRYNREVSDGILRYRDLEIHTGAAKVLRGGEEIELTAMEYRLLLILFNNRGIVLSRNNLLENLWDIDGSFVNDNTLTVYIKRLRNKLEKNPLEPEYIKTVRGIGYVMQGEN